MQPRMGERRKSRRKTVNSATDLFLDERSIRCTLANISRGGALLEIDPSVSQGLGDSDLGKEATFRLESEAQRMRDYTGEIIRLYERHDVLFLALRFWRK